MVENTKIGFWKLISLLLGVFLFLAGLGVEPFYIKVYGVLISGGGVTVHKASSKSLMTNFCSGD